MAFLLIAAFGVSLLAWRQYQELIGLRAAALNSDERANLQKRLWASEKRARELEGELAAARKDGPEDALAALAGQNEGQDPRGNRGPRGNAAGAAALRALMEQPEMLHLLSLQQKAALDARYAALFRKLNLTPEQIDKVKELMIERQTSRQDILAVAREQGIDPRSDPAGFRKLMQDAQAEADNSLKAALGDYGYAQLQQYDQTMPQRGVVNQLQQSLSFTNAPLTEAQADQLVQILASTSPRNENGGTAGNNAGGGFAPGGFRGGFGGGPGGAQGAALAGAFAAFGGANNAPVTTAAITQAQGVLSGPQLAALQQLQQTQQAQQQVQQMIRQTMGNDAGNNAGAAAGGRARRGKQ